MAEEDYDSDAWLRRASMGTNGRRMPPFAGMPMLPVRPSDSSGAVLLEPYRHVIEPADARNEGVKTSSTGEDQESVVAYFYETIVAEPDDQGVWHAINVPHFQKKGTGHWGFRVSCTVPAFTSSLTVTGELSQRCRISVSWEQALLLAR